MKNHNHQNHRPQPQPSPESQPGQPGAKNSDKIRELRAETSRACAEELQGVLDRHDCQIVGIPGLVPDGRDGWKVAVRIEITPK